jgi:hypothetical protein
MVMPPGRSGLSTNEEAAWFDKQLAEDEVEPPREMSKRRMFLLVSGTSIVAVLVMIAIVFAPSPKARAGGKLGGVPPALSLAAAAPAPLETSPPLATAAATVPSAAGSTPQKAALSPSAKVALKAAALPARNTKPATALPVKKKATAARPTTSKVTAGKSTATRTLKSAPATKGKTSAPAKKTVAPTKPRR